VLLSGVQGITDLITTPGLINLDFADVKSVMQGAGSALMGIGSARGEDRAIQAAETAISSPLLEASVDGAHGVLLSIQGGSDLGLFEINEAARLVQEAAHPEANIIFGAVIDDALGDEVRVTVIAAGFDGGQPTRRRDERALGQVSGRSTVPAGARAPQPAAAVPGRSAPLDAGVYAEARAGASNLGPGAGLGTPSPVGGPSDPSRRTLGEYRTGDAGQPEPARQEHRAPANGLPPTSQPVTGAPLGTPSSSQPSGGGQSPDRGDRGDREPAVVHEPVSRFVELPPEPRPTPRPTPRPIVVDDDLDVPDFLK
jgi:cell division protein FtsZ